ncbi:MAG: hypothetical protein PHT94_03335 [Candidatus Nanoarchaeia archaeon]|nr:hypothetical protein [Candidatus Nanoarchaeia archaeon]
MVIKENDLKLSDFIKINSKKVAIFDIDDTLLKTSESLHEYIQDLFGIQMPISSCWDYSDIIDYLKKSISVEDEMYKEIQRLGTDEWFTSFFYSEHGQNIPLESENIYRILNYLKNNEYNIVFLTSRPMDKEIATLNNLAKHDLQDYSVIHWYGSKINFLDNNYEYVIFEDAPHHIKDYLTNDKVKKIFYIPKSFNLELRDLKDDKLIENINYENIIDYLENIDI